MKTILLSFATLILLTLSASAQTQDMRARTYCNPLNVDYTYSIFDSERNLSYRSGADPAVVQFRGEYYMFVTRSHGYWHSKDLLNWDFITPDKWYFQASNAPTAVNYKDSVIYMAGDPSGSMSILYTDNPQKGDWKATPAILHDLQDPGLFIDDDGRAYMFWGSSNVYPIRGMELEKNRRFSKLGSTVELFNKDMEKHGWERFGTNHTDTVIAGFIEGPALTKYNGKYYMEYGAPGTEFNVYGDGVYVADSPMGPYTYQAHNPVSYKPGGFMNGAGHGNTVIGPGGNYWHFASMALSVNQNWERRLCMFPTAFDKDGIMHTDTYFGDYPHFSPAEPGVHGQFSGWMLLSYNKPAKVSTAVGEYGAKNITDENVKSWWMAAKNDNNQWVEIDLQQPATIHAIQINYHDYQSNMWGRYPGLWHRYTVEVSNDSTNWTTIINKSNSYKDTPNDYVELAEAIKTRYVRYRNISVPTPNLAISDIRIFGIGTGAKPATVKSFNVVRNTKDMRDALISWDAVKGAQGYNIRWGIAPDKLYSSWMIYGDTSLLLKALGNDQTYYFTVEAFNENGISEPAKLLVR